MGSADRGPEPPLTDATAHRAFDEAAARVPAEPPAGEACDGTGVVIPGGGARYLPGAYVTAALLRRLGSTLPIEIWHLGPGEMPPRWRARLEGLGARTVDALAMRARHPARRVGGYELKAYALLHTGFRHVLLLDADNVPVYEPSPLFASEPYREHGAIFWPDYGVGRPALPTGVLGQSHPIWALAGVPYRGDREFESGQICVDRRRCYRELALADWMNQRSDFWYRYLFGDKDTFHVAWRKLGRDWAMPGRDPVDLGGMAMAQCDFDGRVVFQHRNGAKWSLGDNPRVPAFRHEALCFALLDELRAALARPDAARGGA
jgi:hypothetical protein